MANALTEEEALKNTFSDASSHDSFEKELLEKYLDSLDCETYSTKEVETILRLLHSRMENANGDMRRRAILYVSSLVMRWYTKEATNYLKELPQCQDSNTKVKGRAFHGERLDGKLILSIIISQMKHPSVRENRAAGAVAILCFLQETTFLMAEDPPSFCMPLERAFPEIFLRLGPFISALVLGEPDISSATVARFEGTVRLAIKTLKASMLVAGFISGLEVMEQIDGWQRLMYKATHIIGLYCLERALHSDRYIRKQEILKGLCLMLNQPEESALVFAIVFINKALETAEVMTLPLESIAKQYMELLQHTSSLVMLHSKKGLLKLAQLPYVEVPGLLPMLHTKLAHTENTYLHHKLMDIVDEHISKWHMDAIISLVDLPQPFDRHVEHIWKKLAEHVKQPETIMVKILHELMPGRNNNLAIEILHIFVTEASFKHACKKHFAQLFTRVLLFLLANATEAAIDDISATRQRHAVTILQALLMDNGLKRAVVLHERSGGWERMQREHQLNMGIRHLESVLRTVGGYKVRALRASILEHTDWQHNDVLIRIFNLQDTGCCPQWIRAAFCLQ